jgi:NADH dehydrogenase
MLESRVLVAGASGQLGSAVVRKLAAAGVPVRALARNREKLAALAVSLPGVEVAAVDLLNLSALTEACRGVGQIVGTANNNMGKGPTGPGKIDLTAYQNLCAAARNAGVRRLIFVSTTGAEPDSPVDLFKIKWYIEDAIKRSGTPYVLLHAAAFMDVWVDQVIAGPIRTKGVATVFGDGTGVGNYIAVDDVAEFIVRILARESVVNETIELGGPSNVSFNELVTMVERRLESPGKRRHVPAAVLKYLPPIVRPFNEIAARLMTLGYYATLHKPSSAWKVAADRFGVSPRTVERYVQEMPADQRR